MADATPAPPAEPAPQRLPAAAPPSAAHPRAAHLPAPSLLDRSDPERLREFKYRFGQSVVFGLPVVALELVGRSLGGPEADRWVTLFQALLAGWVVYVGATGMAIEGAFLLLARRRPPVWLLADLVVASAAMLLYLISLTRLVPLLGGRSVPGGWPSLFAGVVVLLAAWSCLRWWAIKNSAGKPGRV